MRCSNPKSLSVARLSASAAACFLLAGGPSMLRADSRPATRPNIVIIMADQLRAGITKRTGYPLDIMPALDKLARGGVPFDRAYATAPMCSPTRVSLLTGRWPQAHRVRQNSGNRDAYFEKDIFDVLKPLGYRTGMAGKNHSYLAREKLDFWRLYTHLGGWKPEGAPNALAEFDRWLARLNHGVAKEATPFPPETQLPYRIVSDAIDFMKVAGDQPFLLWVSFPEPHNPYQVPKPYFDMFPPEAVPDRAAGPEVLEEKGFKWQWLRQLEEGTYPGYDEHWRRTKSNYLGMVRLIDDQLARLLRFLRENNRWNNTIVVVTADHGDYLTDYGLMRKGVEMPEALIRVPMVWAGGGIQGKGVPHPAFVSIADVLPTLCEAAGAEIPRGAQGRSLWPLLRGEAYPEEEFRSIYAEVGFGGLHYDASDNAGFQTAKIKGTEGATETFDELNSVTQSGYMKMVRMGEWKLTFDMMGSGQLYHLASDPHELKNRFGDPALAAIQMQLLQELLQWNIRTQDNLPTANYKGKWAEHNWYAPYRRNP